MRVLKDRGVETEWRLGAKWLDGPTVNLSLSLSNTEVEEVPSSSANV
jgi:hypothetical protein